MKKIVISILQVIGLLVTMLGALLLGSLPFLVSFILGLSLKHFWIAYALALTVTIAATLLSSAFPEAFRFGNSDLTIHDNLFIVGVPSLAANLAKNILFAHLGAATGIALREGYKTKKIEQVGDGDAEEAV